MDDHIDLVDTSGLLDRASRKHGDAGDGGRSNATGENSGARSACAAGQDNMSHDLGNIEKKTMLSRVYRAAAKTAVMT